MPKRGRPRGLTINPVAVEEALKRECVSKSELADEAKITTGHLADMLYRCKGASEPTIRLMAARLHVEPATIAPELTRRFVAVRTDVERADAETAA